MAVFPVSAAIPWQSWVVVCDGAQARIFRNDGEADRLNLHQMASLPQQRFEMCEAPQAYRHANEDDVGGDADQERFLDSLANRLEGAVRVGAVERFVLVAPPKALASLLRHLGPLGRGALSGEASCDMTPLSTASIERRLSRGIH